MGRLLGIDYGDRRVGVAVSDPTRMLATPLCLIDDPTGRTRMPELLRLAREKQADGFVLGLPVNMNGSEGPAAQKVRAFAEELRKASGLEVVLWDERLSTVTAQNALIEGGMRREKRKNLVDKLAAQVMLQHYLDAQAPAPEWPSP